MTSRGVSALKFVGTVSLGLLTVSYPAAFSLVLVLVWIGRGYVGFEDSSRAGLGDRKMNEEGDWESHAAQHYAIATISTQ
jgi:hypothetical protein